MCKQSIRCVGTALLWLLAVDVQFVKCDKETVIDVLRLLDIVGFTIGAHKDPSTQLARQAAAIGAVDHQLGSLHKYV